MLQFSNAKINLGLHITKKREDGYHEIETVFYPVNWCDVLEIVPATSNNFETYGIEIPGEPMDNLCVQAYSLLQENYGIDPVNIHLLKNIPIGAGLGGGSSNASFTLSTLSQLFELNLPKPILKEYADFLGSDCSFFLENKPQFASGRGNHLQDIELDLSAYQFVLVYPNLHINTAWAYSQITPKIPDISLAEILIKYPVEKWKGILHNDFQEPIVQEHPIIGELIELCYKHQAVYSAMSGSGSTVFGIFEKDLEVDALLSLFKKKEYLFWSSKEH